MYGPVFRNGGNASFEATADIAELYLTVCATPSRILDIPMTGDFRSTEQEPFPWRVSLVGCEPLDVLKSNRENADGQPHPNGGGLVAAGAVVEATAWVGPDARVLGGSKVLGRARVEDFAVVRDSVVRDDAVLSGHALALDLSARVAI